MGWMMPLHVPYVRVLNNIKRMYACANIVHIDYTYDIYVPALLRHHMHPININKYQSHRDAAQSIAVFGLASHIQKGQQQRPNVCPWISWICFGNRGFDNRGWLTLVAVDRQLGMVQQCSTSYVMNGNECNKQSYVISLVSGGKPDAHPQLHQKYCIDKTN